MSRNRVWLFGAVLCLAILLLAIPAAAWEFSMTGAFTWNYEYRSQLGSAGFFGAYDVDVASTALLGLQSVNGWLGSHSNNLQNQGNGAILVSGADGSWNTIFMDTNMEVRINPALRIRGRYHIGEWAASGWSNATTGVTTSFPAFTTWGIGASTNSGFQQGEGALVQSQYQNFRFPGVRRSFSPGYWNTLWLTAQLPWGEIALGKRPSMWGTGLAWDGVDSRSSEQLTLFAIYGPLRLGMGFYPSRTGSEGYVEDSFDKSGVRVFDMTVPNIIYRNGPLDAGVQFNWVRRHRGADRVNILVGGVKETTRFRDRNDCYGGIYAKYFNGRFFYNAELDWQYRLDRLGLAAGPLASADYYQSHIRLMTELGAVCGPAKIDLLYSWSAGNDRRGGIANNATSGNIANIEQGTLVEPTNNQTGGVVSSTSFSNTSLYRPYSYLMVYCYGLGTHIQGDTGNGYVEDASCYAARLDYAVAANLNVYGSFFWADRVGNAYGWGFLKPAQVTAPGFPNQTLYPTTNVLASSYVSAVAFPGTSNASAPTIPDNNLGYEFDAGFDWKLLEGLTLNATFAYWRPGKWFNFACVDKGMAAWNVQAAGNRFGINPNRDIDSLFGMEMKIVGSF